MELRNAGQFEELSNVEVRDVEGGMIVVTGPVLPMKVATQVVSWIVQSTIMVV